MPWRTHTDTNTETETETETETKTDTHHFPRFSRRRVKEAKAIFQLLQPSVLAHAASIYTHNACLNTVCIHIVRLHIYIYVQMYIYVYMYLYAFPCASSLLKSFLSLSLYSLSLYPLSLLPHFSPICFTQTLDMEVP